MPITVPTPTITNLTNSGMTINWDSASGGTPPYSYTTHVIKDSVDSGHNDVLSPDDVGGLDAGVYEVYVSAADESPSSGNSEIIQVVVGLAPSYSSLEYANNYFVSRLYVDAWNDATLTQKQQALSMGKEFIDRLNFIGHKTDQNQTAEWPRSGIWYVAPDTVPTDIKNAECLIALELLSGFDIETELRNSRVTSRGFSSVRTTYDPTLMLEWLAARIPSGQAWSYLKPYLYDNAGIGIRRVS